MNEEGAETEWQEVEEGGALLFSRDRLIFFRYVTELYTLFARQITAVYFLSLDLGLDNVGHRLNYLAGVLLCR